MLYCCMQLLPLHATAEQGGAHNILVYRGTPFSTQSSKTLHAKLELYVEEGLARSATFATHMQFPTCLSTRTLPHLQYQYTSYPYYYYTST